MKARVRFHHIIEVTREVEVDPDALAAWRLRKEGTGKRYSTDEDLLADMLDNDEELAGEVFSDWRTSEPLPDDFEFQYTSVMEAVIVR